MLLIKRGVECTCFSYKSSIFFLRHTISFDASDVATYSSLVVEYVGIDYLCDLQQITPDPRLIT